MLPALHAHAEPVWKLRTRLAPCCRDGYARLARRPPQLGLRTRDRTRAVKMNVATIELFARAAE
jgi:hypothetical protein